eukprot:CAMPEP_0113469330 /NCGR_PEP_ID=MMETSP0014_2-20120614/15839_1 /TAXON_ID=2857 /ORGANISM="Nitzschia sp." /LENGTH=672 /DNA_ID=CAMNT_0000361795 /DNA_START=227 /DNA_END=2241 /DNA_ORIENTATION=+ /assembly_acc=CAM_ASM_000159
MNCCSCCSLLLDCFAKHDNFKNDSNESHNDVVVAYHDDDDDDDDDKLIDQILLRNKSNIHVLSVNSWKQLLSARGDRLWSIRREMFSSSSLPPSTTASTSPAAVSRPDPIVLVITSSPSTFQDLELNYGMDKPEPTMTMSPLSSSSKKAQPTSPCLPFPLTRCTGRHWETQRPKVQHGFRYIAERSQRCLVFRASNNKYSHCCSSSSSSSSSKSLLSIEDVMRQEILSTNIDTVQARQPVDLKVEVHGTVIRWIVRMFCRSNSLSLSVIEQNRLQTIEEVFDCYWKSIRLPRSPPDPSTPTTKKKQRPSFSRKKTKHNTTGSMMSVQEPHRLQLSQQLQEQLFYLQEMEGKNEKSSNLHNQHHNADGDHDPSSPASSPLPLPILLELALSFEANPSDDDDNDMMTAAGGGGEHQPDVVDVVDTFIANTINAMIAAADACQSLVFWTLWNLGRKRQWWIECRSEHIVSSSTVDSVEERTRHDLIELAALKQKATKGLRVRWYWSDNAGSTGAGGSSSQHRSPSGLSMLGCAIMETVRYFPPVWTLPRTINLRPDSNNNNKATPSPIFVKLDVICINKAYDVRNWNPAIKYDKDAADDDENKNENEEVAAHQDPEDGPGYYLASFGFGKRHCPAGTASLHAAYLISQHFLRRWEEIVDMGTENEVDDDDGKEKS